MDQLCRYIENFQSNRYEDETNGDVDSSTSIEETSSDEAVKMNDGDTNHGSADSNTNEENSDNNEVIWSCNYNNNAN